MVSDSIVAQDVQDSLSVQEQKDHSAQIRDHSMLVIKMLSGISLLVGSIKIYNFCMKVYEHKSRNHAKIKQLIIRDSDHKVVQEIQDIIVKLDKISHSVNRYDHELNLLRKARKESEELFIYLRYI
jgi:hypothetical protein